MNNVFVFETLLSQRFPDLLWRAWGGAIFGR